MEKNHESSQGVASIDTNWRYEVNNSCNSIACLKKAEEVAIIWDDWLNIVISLEGINANGSFQYMHKAEATAVNIDDWLNIIHYWIFHLDRKLETDRCIEMIKGNFNNSFNEYVKCANFWRSWLNADSESLIYLKKAENLAVCFSDWTQIVDLYCDINNKAKIYHCLKQAEKTIKSRSEFKELADYWKKVDNKKKTFICLYKNRYYIEGT